MKKFTIFNLGLILAVILVISNCFYIVEESKQALVIMFGRAIDVVKDPGIKFKVPLLHEVVIFDKRVLKVTSEDKEFTTKDQKRLIVNAFTKYRIEDPLKFYQSIGREYEVVSRLGSVVDSSMRQVIGEKPFGDLLTDKRIQIMADIKESVGEKAKNFGIKVIDVRVSRTDSPKDNSEKIYNRMRSEREKEAKSFRAEGAEEAQRIKASADKEKILIIAEANKKSQEMRGEGDAEAEKVYSQAYGLDKDFFEFYRTVSSYKNSLNKDNTQIIFSSSNDYLKYLFKQEN